MSLVKFKYKDSRYALKLFNYIQRNDSFFGDTVLEYPYFKMTAKQLVCLPEKLRYIDKIQLEDLSESSKEILLNSEYMIEGLEYVKVRITSYFVLYIPLRLPDSISIGATYNYICNEEVTVPNPCKFKDAKCLEYLSLTLRNKTTKFWEGLSIVWELGLVDSKSSRLYKYLTLYMQ